MRSYRFHNVISRGFCRLELSRGDKVVDAQLHYEDCYMYQRRGLTFDRKARTRSIDLSHGITT